MGKVNTSPTDFLIITANALKHVGVSDGQIIAAIDVILANYDEQFPWFNAKEATKWIAENYPAVASECVKCITVLEALVVLCGLSHESYEKYNMIHKRIVYLG